MGTLVKEHTALQAVVVVYRGASLSRLLSRAEVDVPETSTGETLEGRRWEPFTVARVQSVGTIDDGSGNPQSAARGGDQAGELRALRKVANVSC